MGFSERSSDTVWHRPLIAQWKAEMDSLAGSIIFLLSHWIEFGNFAHKIASITSFSVLGFACKINNNPDVPCAPRVGKKERNQSMKQPWTGWLMSERRMKKYNNFALPSRFDVVVVVVDAIIFRILRTKLFIFLKLFFVWFARIYLFWHFLFRDQARRFIRSCGSVFDVRTLLRFTRSKN